MLSHIKRVDIEFHSYCNRRCEWCPNITLERDGKDIIMDDLLFTKIIKELCDNNFGKPNLITLNSFTTPLSRRDSKSIFSFIGYQEPFSSPELFKKRVNYVYDNLPTNVQITASTNGDFLKKEHLDELALTTLIIMDYDNRGMEYWENRLKELDILVIEKDLVNETLIGVHRYVGGIRVQCNWSKHWKLENRGGFFKKEDLPNMNWLGDMDERNFVCYEPSEYLTISYNGEIMPCCHTRGDNPLHKDYIMGNVKNNTIAEIINSNKYIDFKTNLLKNNVEHPQSCKYCQKSRPENIIKNNSWDNFREFWFKKSFNKLVD